MCHSFLLLVMVLPRDSSPSDILLRNSFTFSSLFSVSQTLSVCLSSWFSFIIAFITLFSLSFSLGAFSSPSSPSAYSVLRFDRTSCTSLPLPLSGALHNCLLVERLFVLQHSNSSHLWLSLLLVFIAFHRSHHTSSSLRHKLSIMLKMKGSFALTGRMTG